MVDRPAIDSEASLQGTHIGTTADVTSPRSDKLQLRPEYLGLFYRKNCQILLTIEHNKKSPIY